MRIQVLHDAYSSNLSMSIKVKHTDAHSSYTPFLIQIVQQCSFKLCAIALSSCSMLLIQTVHHSSFTLHGIAHFSCSPSLIQVVCHCLSKLHDITMTHCSPFMFFVIASSIMRHCVSLSKFFGIVHPRFALLTIKFCATFSKNQGCFGIILRTSWKNIWKTSFKSKILKFVPVMCLTWELKELQ